MDTDYPGRCRPGCGSWANRTAWKAVKAVLVEALCVATVRVEDANVGAVVYWAVSGAVTDAMDRALYNDPPHPARADFLFIADQGAP